MQEVVAGVEVYRPPGNLRVRRASVAYKFIHNKSL